MSAAAGMLTARAAAPASRLRRGARAARAQRALPQHATARAPAFMTGVPIGSSTRAAPMRAVATGRRLQRGAACSAARPQAAPADGSGMTVLVAEKLGAAGIDMLKAYGTVVEAFDMSQADLCAKVSLCDALIVRSATKARAPPASPGRRDAWLAHISRRRMAPVRTRRVANGADDALQQPHLAQQPQRVTRSPARFCRPARAASRWSAAPAWALTTWTWRPPRRQACSW
jgi:hypothetical protein